MILTGATAMAGQIIFLREFLVVFYGNEISIGIILAAWLAWGAIGSIISGRFSDRISSAIGVFSCGQIALAAILPITLLFIRISKNIMGISTGEIVGYNPMILSTFVILMVPCAIMGFMFSLACRIYRDAGDRPDEGIAHIYVMEAIGALFGGLLVSYVLIRFTTSFDMIFGLFLLNMMASVVMLSHSESRFLRGMLRRGAIAVTLLSAVLLLCGGAGALSLFSLERLWSGFNVIESKDSVYGNITVTERG